MDTCEYVTSRYLHVLVGPMDTCANGVCGALAQLVISCIHALHSCMQSMLRFWGNKEPEVVKLFKDSYGPDARIPHLYNWGKADAGPGVPNHDNGLEGYNPTIKKALEKKKRVITEVIPILLSHTSFMSVQSEKKGFVDQPTVPQKDYFGLWKNAHAISKGEASWWLLFLKNPEYQAQTNEGVTMIFMPTFETCQGLCLNHKLNPGHEKVEAPSTQAL